jgi:hypothetical protein
MSFTGPRRRYAIWNDNRAKADFIATEAERRGVERGRVETKGNRLVDFFNCWPCGSGTAKPSSYIRAMFAAFIRCTIASLSGRYERR